MDSRDARTMEGRDAVERDAGRELIEDLAWAGHVRVLERGLRDLEGAGGQGRILPAGTRVLFHPAAPHEVREATPENRRQFEARDRTWTAATRARVWFREPATFGIETRMTWNRARRWRGRLLGAVGRNLNDAVGTPWPGWQRSGWGWCWPWGEAPAVREHRRVADLGAELAAELRRFADVPGDVPWTPAWSEWLQSANALEVHALRRGRRTCLVFVAFLFPVAVTRGGEPALATATPALLDAVRRVVERWRERSGAAFPPDTSVFGVVGWEGPLPSESAPPSGARGAEVWVAFQPDGRWRTSEGPCEDDGARSSRRGFLDRLKPETDVEWWARLREVVDAELAAYAGNVSESRLAGLIGERTSRVREALVRLRAVYPRCYGLARLADGEIAIRRRDRSTPRSGWRMPGGWSEAARRHALVILGLTTGALLGLGHAWLRDRWGLSPWVSVVCGIAIAYVGRIIQQAINEHADRARV